MLQRLLIITLTLCSLTASAQWQQTGSKVRYVNGLGIPTKDTAAGVAADSSQILIRPADSSLYIKYKRTWVKVGAGGGGTIGGSGTTNYVPKFTAGTTIGNSQIFDNGTKVGIGYGGVGAYKFGISYSQASNSLDGLVLNATTLTKSYTIWSANAISGGLYGLTNPYTGFINYTDAAATSYINDGSGYFSWHNSSAELMRLTNTGRLGIGETNPGFDLYIKNSSVDASGYYIENTTAGASPSGRRLAVGMGGSTAFGVSNWVNSGFIEGQTANGLYIGFTGGNLRFGSSSRATRMTLLENGRFLINTPTDNGIDQLQVNGSISAASGNGLNTGGFQFGAITSTRAYIYNSVTVRDALSINSATDAATFASSVNVTTLATTNNLSVTTNATVGGNARVSGTLIAGTTADNGVDELQVNGSISGIGFKQAYVTKTGAYTATNDDYVIDCTSGTFTVTLPASSGRTGRILIIKNSGAGTITVDGNASETIDGAATYSLAVQYATVQIMSDGTNWKIIAKF